MLTIYLSMLNNEPEKMNFTEIYEKLKLPCLHIAIKITGNQAMAEDAVHNAFCEVIKHKDEIFNLPADRQKSKIMIITKNKAIDQLRKVKSNPSIPIDNIEDEISSDALDLSSGFENKETFEYLVGCIGKLPEIYKTVFELRYVHDMSNTEIAGMLGITQKTVSMRINRAKEKLRKMIRKGGVLNEPR